MCCISSKLFPPGSEQASNGHDVECCFDDQGWFTTGRAALHYRLLASLIGVSLRRQRFLGDITGTSVASLPILPHHIPPLSAFFPFCPFLPLSTIALPRVDGEARDQLVMRTVQGQYPEDRRASTCKSRPAKKKFHALPDNVEVHVIDDDDDSSKDYSVEDASKQLVIYNAEIAHDEQRAAEVTEPVDHYTSPHQSFKKPKFGHGTVLPSIGAYTVQCAQCYKWRVVPTKQKYEELRESICQELFVCERACEWNRVLSCDDPEDMSQDESRVWAIDKPNIVQPPPGWDREVRLRGASNKFADVYYTSPSSKKLRSMVEIGRYLAENPDYIRQGVNLSQFSFTIPKPVHEVNVQKSLGEAHGLPELAEIAAVDPLCWAAPPTRRELLGERGASSLNHVDLYQPDVPGHAHLHQPEAFESPAQRLPKKRTLKQVLSRKYHLHQPDVPGHAHLHQPESFESPAQRLPKKRTVKQVSSRKSRKCRKTPSSATCSFENQSEGYPNDIEHVLL
ncbi:hypothetical protein PR202_ga14451 [Eleusine coracana subsp. coracana]|uniref:Methyl-CpG-binding domain-containing protein 2 n=1 Tax=Eleusine coracana subsp. coracana TaxID=191504 RepID=A0AAV5CHJ3_ELECO|nr:hypothetical protein PR202_ga14451 [Eleusine coracana subsp. coracana]